MDETELLSILKTEWLLSEARTCGAREAYQRQACKVAGARFKFYRGAKIIIKFADKDGTPCDVMAIFDGIEWCDYGLKSPGPALYGWRIAKQSSRKSPQREPLALADYWRHISLATPDQLAEIKKTGRQP